MAKIKIRKYPQSKRRKAIEWWENQIEGTDYATVCCNEIFGQSVDVKKITDNQITHIWFKFSTEGL